MAVQVAKSFADESVISIQPISAWPHVHGGSQFVSRRVPLSTATGRLLRDMDMCNQGPEIMAGNVSRILVELCLANYPFGALRFAIGKVTHLSWLNTRQFYDVVRFSNNALFEQRRAWDALQVQRQTFDLSARLVVFRGRS